MQSLANTVPVSSALQLDWDAKVNFYKTNRDKIIAPDDRWGKYCGNVSSSLEIGTDITQMGL